LQQYDYLVADTSFLVHLDRRGREKLRDLLMRILRELNVRHEKIIIPPVVKLELVDQPLERRIYLDSVGRFQDLINEGIIEARRIDYGDPRISKVSDEARRYLAKKAGKYEHLVEKADIEVIALTFNLVFEGHSVVVAVRDKALKEVLQASLRVHKLAIKVKIFD